MAGVETALGIYSLITGTITIIGASIQIYDAVKDKSGIPSKLRKVSDKLPSLVEILQGAEAQYKAGQPDESTWVSVGEDVKRCGEACQELQDLLKSAYPTLDASPVARFFKSTGTVLSGKEKTAEQLLAEIYHYLKLLVDRHVLTNTALLRDLKETVDELLPQSGLSQHNIYGTNIGRDQVFNNSQTGTGQQFNGPGGTYNFHSGVFDEMDEAYKIHKLQEWLRFDELEHRRATIVEPHEKTFRWAFEPMPSSTRESLAGSDFTHWLQKGDGLYWIQGIMGSGKSTLMRYISEHDLFRSNLEIWARGHTLRTASFYFTKVGSSVLQRSLQGLYRTLLASLIQDNKKLALLAFPSWQLSDCDRPNPPIGILRDALQRILESNALSQRFCFIIDGLDEYEENDSLLKTQLAKDILRLAKLPGIKILAASRPEASFVGCFDDCPTMELHQLTKNDIVAYVEAELSHNDRTRGLTRLEMADLAAQVVRKAGGVFLWVILAVANILNGAIYGEAYPDLRMQLEALHNDVYALFKQVISVRVQPQHRRETARCLLMSSQHRKHVFWAPEFSVRDFRVGPWLLDRSVCPLAVYATGQHVDTSYDFDRLPLEDPERIAHQAERLRETLPLRSCGLLAWTPFGIRLLHSSMEEFLATPEVVTMLQEQAGDGFDAIVALAAGRMTDLVLMMRGMIEGKVMILATAPEDQQGKKNQIMAQLLEILHCIELTKTLDNSAQTGLLLCFDRLLEQHWGSSGASKLFELMADSIFWDRLYIMSNSWRPTTMDLASLAVTYGCPNYVRHLTQIKHDPQYTAALLHRILKLAYTYPSLGSKSAEPITRGRLDEHAYFDIAQTLLEAGVDPNDKATNAESPWGSLISFLCSWSITTRDQWPLPSARGRDQAHNPVLERLRREARTSLLEYKSAFHRAICLAEHMLNHGADPAFGLFDPHDRREGSPVNVDAFAELPNRFCCGVVKIKDCSCAYARELQPHILSIVDLLEAKRNEKSQKEFERHAELKRKRNASETHPGRVTNDLL